MRSLESFKRIIVIAMSFICILFQVGIYGLFWFGYFHGEMYLKFYFNGHVLMLFVYGVMLLFFSQMYGGMRIGYLRSGEVMFSQVFATICVNGITYLQMCLMSRRFLNVSYIFYMTILDSVIIVLWTSISATIYPSSSQTYSVYLQSDGLHE